MGTYDADAGGPRIIVHCTLRLLSTLLNLGIAFLQEANVLAVIYISITADRFKEWHSRKLPDYISSREIFADVQFFHLVKVGYQNKTTVFFYETHSINGREYPSAIRQCATKLSGRAPDDLSEMRWLGVEGFIGSYTRD